MKWNGNGQKLLCSIFNSIAIQLQLEDIYRKYYCIFVCVDVPVYCVCPIGIFNIIGIFFFLTFFLHLVIARSLFFVLIFFVALFVAVIGKCTNVQCTVCRYNTDLDAHFLCRCVPWLDALYLVALRYIRGSGKRYF